MRELEPASWYLSPAASVIVVYVLPLIAAGGLALLWFFRWQLARRRARDARRSADDESRTLDEGDTIIHGRVAYDGPSAVSVTIEQEGSEAESSGSWSVTWTEMRRRVDVAPFYVVHPSGERVRVEPDRKTRLAADLVAVERVDLKHRRRIARIAEGDEVWVTGVLAKEMDPKASGGYRGGRVWVMRPRGSMLVSTHVPERALVVEASRARMFALLFTLLLGVMLATHLQYHFLFLTGHPATGVVTDKRIEKGDDDSYAIAYDAKDEHGVVVRGDVHVTATTFDAWNAGDQLPAFMTSDPVPLADPGHGARAIVAPSVMTAIVWLMLTISSLLLRVKSWYDGAPVNDTASGRLAS